MILSFLASLWLRWSNGLGGAICILLLLVRSAVVAGSPVQVVLLAGQSNMAGAGNFNALSPIDQTRAVAVATRIEIIRRDECPVPLSFDVSDFHLERYGFAETFGPELFIGIALAEARPDREFLFIKYAWGGTTLEGAWNPEWTAEKAAVVESEGPKRTLRLYHLHHAAIRAALGELRSSGRDYEIIGMAWMQGENDAAREVAARAYDKNLRNLIAGYRTAFGARPPLLFVCGQINSTYGSFPEGPEMVRSAMEQVVREVPGTVLIATSIDPAWSDYPKHDDNIHYNTEGQKRLGMAMGKALLNGDTGESHPH